MKSKSIKQVLSDANERLSRITDLAGLDAELLLAKCLNKNRSYLHTWPEKNLDEVQLSCFEQLLQKRLTDFPAAYLLGTQSFWTLDLIVTPDVLIPRPETELLVETSLEKIHGIAKPQILDLGTGSGAIALAIASERPDARIVASDASSAALQVAKQNAEKCDLLENITFIHSDWFQTILQHKYDLIVSNPPYINPSDPHLETSIRYEPLQALISENRGMQDIETIIKNSPAYLKQGGWLLLEHGYDQSAATLLLFSNHKFSKLKTLADLAGLDRVSLAQFFKI